MLMACQMAALPSLYDHTSGAGIDMFAPLQVGGGAQLIARSGEQVLSGGQALNSYRNAGAALLQAMQHRGSRSWDGMCAASSDGSAHRRSGRSILSTFPGAGTSASGEACGGGLDEPSSRAAPASFQENRQKDAGFDSLFHSSEQFTAVGDSADLVSFGKKDVVDVWMMPDPMVRNTFIDFKPARSASTERFYEERKCRSSPVSRAPSRSSSRGSPRFASLNRDDPFAIATPTDSTFPTPRSKHVPREDLLQSPRGLPALHGGQLPVLRLSQFMPDGDANPLDRSAATVSEAAARLAYDLHGVAYPVRQSYQKEEAGSAICSTVASSQVGSGILNGCASSSASTAGSCRADVFSNDALQAQVPNRGSALHALGACKPCAFVFQNACVNGADCDFCHLCDTSERKRRKKERRKMASSWKHGLGMFTQH